jgi:membrane associated rhomboid family serine protease
MTLRLLLALAFVQVMQWTAVMPTDLQAWAAFTRDAPVQGRWWTLFTHPFVQPDLALLLLNLYVIGLFGLRLERAFTAMRYGRLLALATLTGWSAHLLTGSSGVWLGASSAAYGVLGAYTMRWGDDAHLLFGRFPLRGRWLTAIVAGILTLTGLETGPGFLAHLGGLAAVWFLMPRGGRRVAPPRPTEPEAAEPTERVAPSPDRRAAPQQAARATAAQVERPVAEPPRPAPPSIDAILDKISAEGIDHLTDEERRVLDDHSRRLRDR